MITSTLLGMCVRGLALRLLSRGEESILVEKAACDLNDF